MFPEIKLTIPTDEEVKASALRWYDRVGFSFIDQWPEQWRAASMPTTLLPLQMRTIKAMIDGPENIEEWLNERDELADSIDRILDWRPHMIRLNSRSPKDMSFPSSPVTVSGRTAVHWLAGSERVFDDLCKFYSAKKPAFIALREYIWMPSEGEFRCFVRDGELIAITQYDYVDNRVIDFLQTKTARDTIWTTIEAWWKISIHPYSPVQEYVFDVFSASDPLLIEVNPYGLSDPCCAKSYANVELGGFFFNPTGGEEGIASNLHKNNTLTPKHAEEGITPSPQGSKP
jgi:hypothetical protein